MKKLLGVLVVVLVFVVGWMWLRQQRMVAPWNEPKWAPITRGDIRVPITAAGLIEPNQTIEVKSKASGEIIEINVIEGNFVRKGDVLVKLEPVYEERNVARAKAALDRASSLLETARVDVLKAKSDVQRWQAQIDQLQAEGRVAARDLEEVKQRFENDQSSAMELITAQSRVDVNAAQLRSAEASRAVSENTVLTANETVKIQAAAVTEAENTNEDAKERLAETTIIAPEDSIVTKVEVEVGEVIQGGANTFTGGTILVRLADVSKKKVLARVDESDYGRVLDIAPLNAMPEMPQLRAAAEADAETMQKRGGAVTLTVDAYPEDKFAGVIERVEPQGNLNVGSSIIQFDVMVEITDQNRHKLPLGAQAQVDFTVESAVDVLRVPAEAAKSFEGERGVWVKIPPPAGSSEQWGKRFVPCRFGITDGAHTHLIEPLNNEKLDVGVEVYTKVPVEKEDEDDR
jgi:HlyD family secretion protein